LSAQAQDPYKGIWEGKFMEQFKTVILLDHAENAKYLGKILISGENHIQDDELSQISIEISEISFYIEAKKTIFRGIGIFIYHISKFEPLTYTYPGLTITGNIRWGPGQPACPGRGQV
jgi:hypothetical protein